MSKGVKKQLEKRCTVVTVVNIFKKINVNARRSKHFQNKKKVIQISGQRNRMAKSKKENN